MSLDRGEKELFSKIHKLESEIDRLNRIMPHIGGTCTHQTDDTYCDLQSSVPLSGNDEAHNECFYRDICDIDQWELKDDE